MAGLLILEPIPRIYIDDVRREPYTGIWNEGTKRERSEMSRMPIMPASLDVKILEAMGWLRRIELSFGCDTTTTSSRLKTLDVSAMEILLAGDSGIFVLLPLNVVA